MKIDFFYLFVIYVTTQVQQLILYNVDVKGDDGMVTWKGFGRKQS
jgi:hypothetical protein